MGLAEGIEEQLYGRANRLIRVEHHRSIRMVNQANRQRHFQFATTRLAANTTLKARLQYMEFRLAHGALQAEQQTVIEMRRVVDAVLVEDQRPSERGQFEQAVPVGIVTRQARHLQSEHDADAGIGHFGNQTLETIAILGAGAGQAEVAINDMNALDRPPQGHGPIPQCVLAFCALGILQNLPERGLTHIEKRIAPKVLCGHFLELVSRHGWRRDVGP